MNNSSTESLAFDRKVDGFQRSTLDRSKTAKLKLEMFYKNMVDQVREREDRYITYLLSDIP
jgi:hypothetical protein